MMNQPDEKDKCVCCCECCELYACCILCTKLCDCECKYNCNCFANYWFCNPDVCFPLFKISIYPCMLSFCASHAAVCCSLHLVALILMVSCCGGAGQSASGDLENPCKICDECDEAWTWIPLWKMCNELKCSYSGYENASRDEEGRFFWSTSYTCFNETFCTESEEQKADTVTVQPQAQTQASMPSAPKSNELPSYEQFEAFSAIAKIELVPGNRENWQSVSDVSDV